MNWIYYTILAVYSLTLVYITFYCLMQFHLLYHYKKSKKNPQTPPPHIAEFPFVTIQLPVFNEMYVVERLIDCIMAMDYPRDCFEVQILDDSTDETSDIIRAKVRQYSAQGFQIKHLHRSDRKGFKAGALKEGMKSVRGEFIAIFDADFLPRRDFLKSTLPYFQNQKTGVVQTRWEHLNENYSLLTRLQALQLNVHFTVEQQGRSAGKYLLQFNGTAGIWRREAVETSGGWQADTLTEDLDLSIRAQLRGWEIVYLENVGSPAELPAEISGIKSQQFRWMKGGAETAKKMLPAVWRSQLAFHQKLHTTLHLLASAIFLFVFVAGVLSVPLIFAMHQLEIESDIFTFFLAGWISIITIYYAANVENDLARQPYLKRFLKFIFLFPLFLGLSMGLSLHNSVAVLQGYLGKKSSFVRTPKFNLLNWEDSLKNRKYISGKFSWTTIMEGLLTIYFLGGIGAGLYFENSSFLLFHSLFSFGYGTIFYYSVKHFGLK